MSNVIALVKNSLKLLIRNKAVWIFAVVLPCLALFVLNLDMKTTVASGKVDAHVIGSLEDSKEELMYKGVDGLYSIKVYDSSGSKLSDLLLKNIADNGIFAVYRYDSSEMSDEEVEKNAIKNASMDRIGVILYITPQFEEEILNGVTDKGIMLYHTSNDERIELFNQCLQQGIEKLIGYRNISQGDAEDIIKLSEKIRNQQPQKEIESISNEVNTGLSSLEDAQLSKIGYSFGILTLSFFFCGVFIAYSVIEEKKSLVYTRISLTNASPVAYALSKMMIGVLVSFIETVMIGIGLVTYVKIDFGISQLEYMLFVFLLGIICNTLSLCIGVLAGNIMSANYAVFSFWCISNLLAGVYFPIDNVSQTLKNISYFMPQRWFIKVLEMKLAGNSNTYLYIFCVFGAYMVIILSLGVAGLRIKSEE